MCAAYGTVMLLYVMIGSTILSIGLWLMSYNIMWMIMVVSYEISLHLVGYLYDLHTKLCIKLKNLPLNYFDKSRKN